MIFRLSEPTASLRRIPFVAVDFADGVSFKTGIAGAFAGADIRISKNGADSGNFAGTVTEVSAANMPGLYYYEATVGEFDTPGFFALRFADAAMRVLFENIQIATLNLHASIENQVWDALLANHLVAGSFGRAGQPVRDGTAQAGAASTITLDAGASATDNLYTGGTVRIIGGTGAGQSARAIVGYVGASKVATVSPAWTVQPDNTSVFVITGVAGVGAFPAAFLATIFEGTETLQDYFRLSSSAIYRRGTGLNTNSPAFRDAANSKNRIASTWNPGTGERTTVLDAA